MRDICDENFCESADVSDVTVGIIGHGYIGQAAEALFSGSTHVRVYDKNKPGLGDLPSLVRDSQLILVCVPTPMEPSGECHTGIVESVIADVNREIVSQGFDPRERIVVIKSTVPPGFTGSMRSRYQKMRIVFSPEFLTEANSVNDFKNADRIIVGGDQEDGNVVLRIFRHAWRDRKDEYYGVICEPVAAELAKLFGNAFLATKVTFANEMYQFCARLGTDYETVAILASMDKRVGSSHLKVPGPDGHLGYGGSCFVKDINGLRHMFRQLSVNERLLTAVIERNDELRPEKDWEKLAGRAVVHNDV